MTDTQPTNEMNPTRRNLLELAWTGPTLTIGGREIVLTHGRHALLGSWRNRLFDPTNESQDMTHAMGETIMVCSATMDEIRRFRSMSDTERKTAVLDFLLDNEDEIDQAAAGIQKRMEALAAAAVDVKSPGKEEPPHAD